MLLLRFAKRTSSADVSEYQRIAPLSESVDEGSSSAARLDKQLSTIETRLAEVAAQNNELKKTVDRLRVYGSQNEQLTKQVASGVKSNRDELVTLAEKMKELIGAGVRPVAPAVSSSTSSSVSSLSGSASSASSPLAATSGDASTYKIQSGDTFAKIASLKGVSLNALLDANPDADPRRLSIGQKINIPAN